MKQKGIDAGCFCMLGDKLVYVNCIIGNTAYITFSDYQGWHKKVPVSRLRAIT